MDRRFHSFYTNKNICIFGIAAAKTAKLFLWAQTEKV